MEKPVDQPHSDIATEHYKGPGALVTGAGEGAIAHYGTMLAGLIGGGALSGIFYKKVDGIEQSFRNFSANNAQHPNIAKRWTANIAGWVQNTADKIAHHMPKSLLQKVPQERVRAVVFGGGILGFLGFFVAPAIFMFSGARHANDGKQQFKRAQDEILTAREERDALREKYVQSQVELDELKAHKTAEGDTGLTVAKDNPPPIEPVREDHTAALSGVNTDSPTEPTAPTIGPAPTTGRTLPGEPPRIKEPVIGPELADGFAAREAAREAAPHEAAR